MNEITITGKPMLIKEYRGQRVVTFKDVDSVHGRPSGTARKRFNDNKNHFIEGEDFYKITPSEFRTAIGEMDVRQRNAVVILTETGYLMLVKSFTDELAWKVQRELVKNYFRKRAAEPKQPEPRQLELYEYIDKTYNGIPVMTTADVRHFTGLSRSNVRRVLGYETEGTDFFKLTGRELRTFKYNNPQYAKASTTVLLITPSGFSGICRFYSLNIQPPEMFSELMQLFRKPEMYKPTDEMVDLIKRIIAETKTVHTYCGKLLDKTTMKEAVSNRANLANSLRNMMQFALDTDEAALK